MLLKQVYRYVAACATLAMIALPVLALGAPTDLGRVTLSDTRSSELQSATAIGTVDANQVVSLSFSLPLQHTAELSGLLHDLYDPKSPHYHQFLTPDQFAARFEPTDAQIKKVTAYAQASGLTVQKKQTSRFLVDVTGTSKQVNKALGVSLMKYRSKKGSTFQAPSGEVSIPTTLSSEVSGVIGLDTSPLREPVDLEAQIPHSLSPNQIGTGPGGGLSPSDIKTAYGLAGNSQDGTGQTLGLVELDGYHASDVTAYEANFGLPNVTLENRFIDGYSGAAGSGSNEVTLDIELAIALAPGLSKVQVYQSANTNTAYLHQLAAIVSDNTSKQVSTSWGLYELGLSSFVRTSENTYFQQMAAQGQSMFAASGDAGDHLLAIPPTFFWPANAKTGPSPADRVKKIYPPGIAEQLISPKGNVYGMPTNVDTLKLY